MTVLFWVLAAGMVAAALAILFFGVRHSNRDDALDRDQQNAEIAREKLDKLKQDLAANTLSQSEFDQLRAELEQSLGTDLAGPTETSPSARGGFRGLAIVTAILVPVIAFALYFRLGNPTMLTPLPSGGGSAALSQIADRLAAHLRQQPKDANGWFMLGHVYMQQDHYPEAADAYGRAEQFAPENPDVLLSYADALAMTQGGRLAGKPEQLVDRALQVSPNNTTALWLAGMAANQRGDYAEAVKHWRRVEDMVRDDPKTLKEVRGLIVAAEKSLGHKVPVETQTRVAAHGKTLKVTVRLSPSLASGINPNDTVFVFARAENGPPMPLAVVRKTVRDLPLKLTLDDSMAMMPAMKLSGFTHVLVGARISKTGNAMPQPGDLESGLIRAVPGQKGRIALEINKKVSS
jgi:cytochrome c-type biogenesis protein CcmH